MLLNFNLKNLRKSNTEKITGPLAQKQHHKYGTIWIPKRIYNTKCCL